MDGLSEVERELGPQPGKCLEGHENYINTVGNGSNDRVMMHLPREIVQFESTEQALERGFIPFSTPRGWNVDKLAPLFERGPRGNNVVGYESHLVLDSINVPDGVEGYVASLCRIQTDRLPEHFNVSVQFYRCLQTEPGPIRL